MRKFVRLKVRVTIGMIVFFLLSYPSRFSLFFSFQRGAGRLFLVCQKEIEVDFLMVPFFGGGREGVWGDLDVSGGRAGCSVRWLLVGPYWNAGSKDLVRLVGFVFIFFGRCGFSRRRRRDYLGDRK